MDRSFETRTFESGKTNTNDDNRRSRPDRRKAERAKDNLDDQPILTRAEIDFLLHN